MEIQNKVAIVTGAIGGIGFATIQCLLRNKIKYVGLMDLRKPDDLLVIDSLKTLREEFDNERFGYYYCNVTDVKEFTKCYELITASYSYVDILINNADIASDKNIDLIIDVNLKAVVHCSMIALNHMDILKNGQGGVIVNIASVLGLLDCEACPVYCATKHGIVSFVRSMKEHNKKFGVRIVCVCPHGTDTNMLATAADAVFYFVDSKSISTLCGYYRQMPSSVAKAILEIIEKGSDGAVWVSQKDLPPIPVEPADLSHLGIML